MSADIIRFPGLAPPPEVDDPMVEMMRGFIEAGGARDLPEGWSPRLHARLKENGLDMTSRAAEIFAQERQAKASDSPHDPLLERARAEFRRLPKRKPDTLSPGEVARVRAMLVRFDEGS